jgi:hypothetical protein
MMRRIGRALAAVVVGFAFAAPANASETSAVALEATDLLSMRVDNLRSPNCGGPESKEKSQDAKNVKFAGCVMYVLGVVDMLRDWQKLDPTRAPPVCVPRNVTSGYLFVVVQAHIEATCSVARTTV